MAKRERDEPSTVEYLRGMAPSELHEHAQAALDAFITVVGEMPRNRCYDGFTTLAAQAEEKRIGAAGYLARLQKREADAAEPEAEDQE